MTQPEGVMCFESEMSSAFFNLIVFLWDTGPQGALFVYLTIFDEYYLFQYI